MDHLQFKLEIVEALSASPPTNKSILIDYEDNSVVIPLAKRSKRYNPPAIHVMDFILEAVRDAGLSKSKDFFFINEVLDDAASVMSLTEEER
ncbi:hypothetical protein TNCV_2129781 [Trichonephila clavipes]|nr:hypothetical protein TNCV_2129781 [Trichonephila clavipes]